MFSSPNDANDMQQVRNLPVIAEGKVMGIVNVNDISDFSFSMEELGGKKAYMKNISQRKGLPKVSNFQIPHFPRALALALARILYVGGTDDDAGGVYLRK